MYGAQALFHPKRYRLPLGLGLLLLGLMNATAVLAETTTIRGTVTWVNGEPAQDIRIDVEVFGAGVSIFERSVTTDGDGTYEAEIRPEVNEGYSFEVRVRAFESENPPQWVEREVSATLGDWKTGVDLVLTTQRPGSERETTITGTVTWVNGAPARDIRIDVEVFGAAVPIFETSVTTDGDGTYEAEIRPRVNRSYSFEVRVRAFESESPPQWVEREVSATLGQWKTGVDLMFESDAPASGSAPILISGTVTCTKGQTLPGLLMKIRLVLNSYWDVKTYVFTGSGGTYEATVNSTEWAPVGRPLKIIVSAHLYDRQRDGEGKTLKEADPISITLVADETEERQVDIVIECDDSLLMGRSEPPGPGDAPGGDPGGGDPGGGDPGGGDPGGGDPGGGDPGGGDPGGGDPGDPPGPGGGGRSVGEPHLMTIDGQRYDFHAVGEFVGARSTVDDLELQLRFGPYGDKDRVTTTTAVAARVGDARISVVHGRDPLLWVDGAPAPLESGSLSLGGGASIAKTRNGYEIVWPDGSTSTVDSFRHYLNAYFSPAQSHRGKIVGLLGDFDGNPDNDLVTSAGERIQRPHRFGDIYGKYAPTWRVSQEESLFDYGPGETTETFTDLDYPAGAAAIAQLSTQERQQATEICKSAGVTDLEVLDDCIFDVGYTGVEEFAESASTVQARVEADARRTLQWFDGVSIAAATSGTASFPFAVHVRGAATKDYRVVIAPVGSKAGTSVGHNALRGGEQIVKIDLPRESGSYELRYETKVRPYETRHRQPLTVTAPVARIEAPDVAPAGSRLAMSCVGDCSPNANLAVVPVGTPDQKQGSHHGFMSGGPDVTIRLPEAPGAYEIRYVTRTLPRKVFARKPLTLE